MALIPIYCMSEPETPHKQQPLLCLFLIKSEKIVLPQNLAYLVILDWLIRKYPTTRTWKLDILSPVTQCPDSSKLQSAG